METALRDERHDVYGDPPKPDDRSQDYPWQFNEKIGVPPTDVQEFSNNE
jgi:hypothetical protein